MTTPNMCDGCQRGLPRNVDANGRASHPAVDHPFDSQSCTRDRYGDAPPAPRRPVTGWVETVRGKRFDLGQHGSTGLPRATAYREADSDWWAWYLPGEAHLGHRRADSTESAQLAAEDALRAVLVDAAAALGLRVVPS